MSRGMQRQNSCISYLYCLAFIKSFVRIINPYFFAYIYGSTRLFMYLKMATYKICMGMRFKNGYYFCLLFLGIFVIRQRVTGRVYQRHFSIAYKGIRIMGKRFVFKLFYGHVILFYLN